MPNGYADASYIRDLDRFFAPIAGPISDFAAQHNLLLEKYYHDAPMWSLGFAHPAGGQARIDVMRTESNAVGIGASWWLDDYDSCTRSIRSKEPAQTGTEGEVLTQRLGELLTEVVGWKRDAWTQVATGYKGIWDKTWTKAEFEQLARQWPKPK